MTTQLSISDHLRPDVTEQFETALNIEHFGDLQFALQPGGCEKIITSLAMATETQPESTK